jgi:hypothetical protein
VSQTAIASTPTYVSVSDASGGFNAAFGDAFTSAESGTTFNDIFDFAITGDKRSSASVTSNFLPDQDLQLTSFSLVKYDPTTKTVLSTVATGQNLTSPAAGQQVDFWTLSGSLLTAGTYAIEISGRVIGVNGGSYGGNLLVGPVAAVPEPATYGFVLAGLCLVGLTTLRKKQK